MLLRKIRENMENLKPCGSTPSKYLKSSQITHTGYNIRKVKKFSTAQ
jgi:hypothetical protein